MSAPHPDFDVVDRVFEARLRERGLAPARLDTGIQTGLRGCTLHRACSQAVEYDVAPEPGRGFMASVEMRVALELPDLGEVEVRDLVTQRGPSHEAALSACASTLIDVTFAPLASLFTGARPDGRGAGTATLSSYTVGRDQALAWQVFIGPLQLAGDVEDRLRSWLASRPPFPAIVDALTGRLAERRLHWCKLYAASTTSRGLVARCAMDGERSEEGEAALRSLLRDAPPAPWELRQFIVARPTGDADPRVAASLRALAKPELPRPRKGLWSWLFGR